VAESCRLQRATGGYAIRQQNFSPSGGGPQQARGPHFNNLDASLFKNFHIKDFHIYESTGLEFRVEAFNATNTPQFGPPANVTGYNQSGQSGRFCRDHDHAERSAAGTGWAETNLLTHSAGNNARAASPRPFVRAPI
jgi:hypothetical protein